MRVLKLVLCGLVLVILGGCRQVVPQASLAREVDSAPSTEVVITPEVGALPDLPGGLKLEEHLLVDAPSTEPLTFKPAEGTQAEILAVHADVRGLGAHRYTFDSGYSAEGQHQMVYGLSGMPFSAVEISHNATETIATEPWGTREVRVMRGDEPIYSVQAGHNSPYNSFQGLWAYDERWVLEIAHVVESLVLDSNEVSADVTGMVIDNGVLLNDEHGYDEAFGFQLIAGRPFYFFERAGSVGIAYAGQAVDLGYTRILHYGCCSSSELNPLQSETMVAFFAQRDAAWYYVELGAF
ncbi:MAG: hypothetical protein JXA21_04245 [Anaerolineae bacterium]|nr:hypothetical protein [Anaerolineae bacterium]